MRRRLRPRQTFRQPIAKPVVVGPEHNPWMWNPNHPAVVSAPGWFLRDILALDGGEDVAVTWNPIRERWQVWARSGRIQHPLCQGWRLLFIHHGPNQEYLPLDERLIARLWWASAAAHGSAKQYFDRVSSELQRDKAKAEQHRLNEQLDMAMPYYDHAQIQVSMRGPSNGSKFSTYHTEG